jgi:hypothetical protein
MARSHEQWFSIGLILISVSFDRGAGPLAKVTRQQCGDAQYRIIGCRNPA